MIAIGMANFVLSWVSEKFIFPQIRAFCDRLEALRKKISKKKPWTKKTKKYIMLEESM